MLNVLIQGNAQYSMSINDIDFVLFDKDVAAVNGRCGFTILFPSLLQ